MHEKIQSIKLPVESEETGNMHLPPFGTVQIN